MELRISFAGPDEESSDSLSGGSRFEATLRGANLLGKFQAKFRCILMLFPQTVDAMIAHLPMFRKRLPPRTPLTFGIPFCGGRETGIHMFSTAAALEDALDRISIEAGQRIPSTRPATVVNRREACHCEFGRDLHIRSDGMVYKCFKMTKPIANLKDEGLIEIWGRAKGNCRLARELSVCEKCPLSSLCGSGCRSENALYTGHEEIPLCGLWRVQILAEMPAQDRVKALEWPTKYLINEAKTIGISTPEEDIPGFISKYWDAL